MSSLAGSIERLRLFEEAWMLGILFAIMTMLLAAPPLPETICD